MSAVVLVAKPGLSQMSHGADVRDLDDRDTCDGTPRHFGLSGCVDFAPIMLRRSGFTLGTALPRVLLICAARVDTCCSRRSSRDAAGSSPGALGGGLAAAAGYCEDPTTGIFRSAVLD